MPSVDADLRALADMRALEDAGPIDRSTGAVQTTAYSIHAVIRS